MALASGLDVTQPNLIIFSIDGDPIQHVTSFKPPSIEYEVSESKRTLIDGKVHTSKTLGPPKYGDLTVKLHLDDANAKTMVSMVDESDTRNPLKIRKGGTLQVLDHDLKPIITYTFTGLQLFKVDPPDHTPDAKPYEVTLNFKVGEMKMKSG